MKRVSLLMIAMFSFFYSCIEEIPIPKPPTAGLMAYYPLNGDSKDLSGNGFNGTLHNGLEPTTDRKEKPNHAFKFDGTDDFIETSDAIDDSLSSGASFSAWINVSEAGYGRIVSNYNGEGAPGNCNERIGFVFGVTDKQQLNIFYAVDGDDYIGRMTDVGEIELNTWYHVVGMWDGTFNSEGFQLFINGKRKDTIDQEEGFVQCGYLESLNPFYIGIGHCFTGDCYPFNGKIDEVRIYNRTLSAAERFLLMER